ncbi:hypothetical protein LEP1GSC188_3370 [Leptospira weilii serovar Topaz str. LT2116]|uniref:Uncharacterized protein n=1 Tax=Leptospira weilii serovar Topaz str. LT2116 TaxID=1088540 RepID=M3H0A4_9LEPT|nr:hypothetical protein LEP1GSC188_3370 [Leptospira weilii serovar Topaz str. LT2116]
MLDRKQLLAVHSEFSGDLLREILQEIDPGLTEMEVKRLVKIKLYKIGIEVSLEAIKIKRIGKPQKKNQTISTRKTRSLKHTKPQIEKNVYNSAELGRYLSISQASAYWITRNPIFRYQEVSQNKNSISGVHHLQARKIKSLLGKGITSLLLSKITWEDYLEVLQKEGIE